MIVLLCWCSRRISGWGKARSGSSASQRLCLMILWKPMNVQERYANKLYVVETLLMKSITRNFLGFWFCSRIGVIEFRFSKRPVCAIMEETLKYAFSLYFSIGFSLACRVTFKEESYSDSKVTIWRRMYVFFSQGVTRESSYMRHPSKVGNAIDVFSFIVIYCCPFLLISYNWPFSTLGVHELRCTLKVIPAKVLKKKINQSPNAWGGRINFFKIFLQYLHREYVFSVAAWLYFACSYAK